MQNQTRSEIFDTLAEEYEKFRPKFPLEFISQVISKINISENANILEIGCGTGQATEPFSKLNFNMTAIDPGANLLNIAKSKFQDNCKIKFCESTFEDFNPEVESEKYDFIFAAHSFHWVNPEVGCKKVSELLNDHSYFSTIFFEKKWPDDVRRELDRLYTKYKKDFANVAKANTGPVFNNDYQDKHQYEKYFMNEGIIKLDFELEYNAENYVGLMKTMSDHRKLPIDVQNKFFNELSDVINQFGVFKMSYSAKAKLYKNKT